MLEKAQILSDQQTAMQPRPTQYTVQNKIKGTEGLIYNIYNIKLRTLKRGKQVSRVNRSCTSYNRSKMPAALTHESTERSWKKKGK